jgi:thioredoxin domain-containing protein 5
MAPAWNELGEEFKDHATVLIGDVDCTQQQSVCSEQAVRGYPTIKYYKSGNKEGEKYSGGRSKDALKSFVETTLV